MDDVNQDLNSKLEDEVRQIQLAFNESSKSGGESGDYITTIPVLPKRITIGKPVRATEKTYECTSNDETAQLVFGAVCLYYIHVSSYPNEYSEHKLKEISDHFMRLAEFLNQYELKNSKFKIIKNYETFLVEKGLSGLHASKALSFIKHAKSLTSLSAKQIGILQSIENSTKLIPIEKEQYPLTDWFSHIDWLRAKMAQDGKDKIYQRLSSSRFLIPSFNHTIAELMMVLQEVSRDLADTLKINHFNVLSVNSSISNKSKRDKCYIFQREMLYAATRNANAIEKQTLEVLLHDFCPDARKSHVAGVLKTAEILYTKYTNNKRKLNNFCKPTIFNSDFIDQLDDFLKGKQTSYPVSKAEEICFYWLNCAQTVQAKDARNLQYQDYVFHGTKTKITHLSCDYYKSRAHDFKTTDTLDTTLPMGKALLAFLQNRKAANKLITITSLDVDNAPISRSGLIGKMIRLLQEPIFNERLKTGLQQQKVSTVFLSLVNCFMNSFNLTINEWKSLRKAQGYDDLQVDTYKKVEKYWVPSQWFTGSMIKTAAVHATSNSFRVGKLVNNNSHSSTTEHDVYFSEQNTEHKSTAARLLRFVMEDIENVVFKPDLVEIQHKIIERQIRTQVISQTSGDVQAFDNRCENSEPIDNEGDAIYVIDSVETVVNFLHYIEQAAKYYKALVAHNPSYLEKHVLVEAEWKEYVLNNLISKKVKTEGFTAYGRYKSMLPELFSSQIKA